MRFNPYHDYSPEWAEYYVQYDQWKWRLKRAVIESRARNDISNPDSLDHLLESFQKAIFASNSFCGNKVDYFGAWPKSILQHIFGRTDDLEKLQVMHLQEQKFILEELKRLVDELTRFEIFVRVYQTAVNRLLAKFQRLAPYTEHSSMLVRVKTSWGEDEESRNSGLRKVRARLQSILSTICGIFTSDDGSTSLLLDLAIGQIGSIAPHKDLVALREEVHNGLGSGGAHAAMHLVPELLPHCVDERFRPTFAFLVLQRAWESVLMLLDHKAHRERERGHEGEALRITYESLKDSEGFSMAEAHLLISTRVQDLGTLEADESGSSRSDSRPGALHVFVRVVELLGPESTGSLLRCSRWARYPCFLHLMAKHGLTEWCRAALREVCQLSDRSWKSSVVLEYVLGEDSVSLTPLHYAIIHNHSSTLDFFCVLIEQHYSYDLPRCRDVILRCLSVAVGLGSIGTVIRLLNFSTLFNLGDDIDLAYGFGKSVFHLASQKGRRDIVDLLFDAGANINATEHPRRWTPLFEAAVRGDATTVQHLIDLGADPCVIDFYGWTAKYVAMYRGHFAVAELLHAPAGKEATEEPAGIPYMKRVDILDRKRRTGDTAVILNLGSMQIGRSLPPVQLGYSSSEQTGANEWRLSLEISTTTETRRIRLPILDDQTNVPFVFNIPQDASLRVGFKIYEDPAPDENSGKLLCGGTALLDSNKLLFGPQRQSLVKEHTVSILDKSSLDIVGSILFTYVIVTPFAHLQSPKYSLDDRDADQKVTLIGHRGFGQNVPTRDYLQIGENSIESLAAAAEAGASFVEFDAQVTRDLRPVIYHDFSLSESGTDIPIHDVTVEQYKYTSSVQKPQSDLNVKMGDIVAAPHRIQTRPRSQSLDHRQDTGAFRIRDRIQHTVDFKTKGMKPNTRGDFIYEPFATLEELFQKLPDTVGFNIEIKYPRFHETVEAGVAPVALELNLFVDTILGQVHLYGRNRPIVLSSFTPEVCILLSLKQRAYPVMFITNAGKLPMTDVEKRATSMQVAIKFAKLWGLAGIVFASDVFLLCPGLIGYVKSLDLVCASYGPRNCIPQDVIAQAQAGLDIMIADRVGLVAKTLRDADLLKE
ncbi:Glycerophosphoryl diester phosphodiesterase family-domain-containing protein [Poronia punctata]|nr:Glycerophosphoryl diester phosphodiesterase family-domain-containing protein [Poronia punctata]